MCVGGAEDGERGPLKSQRPRSVALQPSIALPFPLFFGSEDADYSQIPFSPNPSLEDRVWYQDVLMTGKLSGI